MKFNKMAVAMMVFLVLIVSVGVLAAADTANGTHGNTNILSKGDGLHISTVTKNCHEADPNDVVCKITKDGVPYSSQNTRISYVVEGITITEGIVASGVDEPVKDGTFTIHIPENRLGWGAYRYTITVTDGDNVVTTSDYFHCMSSNRSYT
ncbi:MAG: hypothetical protein MJ209_00855 [archaeon]|nr:hypothetical protein [archaeon]